LDVVELVLEVCHVPADELHALRLACAAFAADDEGLVEPCGNERGVGLLRERVDMRAALVEGLVVVEGGVIVEALELLERIDSHQYTANVCLEENEEQEKEEEKTKDIS